MLKTIIGPQGVVTSKLTGNQSAFLELEVPLNSSNSILNITQAGSTVVGPLVETVVFHVVATAVFPEISETVLGRKIQVIDLSAGSVLSASNAFMNYNGTATSWHVGFQDQTYSTTLTAISSSIDGSGGLVWFDSDISGFILANT